MTSNVIHLRRANPSFLGIASVHPNDPYMAGAIDLGIPFEFIPDLPGVLVLIDATGMAISVEACDASMRLRASECWRGQGGWRSVAAVRIAYEMSAEPARRENELVEAHRRLFGVPPIASRA